MTRPHALLCKGLLIAAGLAMLTLSISVAFEVDFARLRQLAGQRYGPPGLQRLTGWEDLLNNSRQLTPEQKLEQVNRFFNQALDFAPDSQVWHRPDYWATPLEALGQGAGDCEDFAFAKYFSLQLTGIPVARLRLTYVRASRPGQASLAHMVLSYYPTPDSEPLVLDNLRPQILPASQRKDLFPIFSFDSANLWVSGTPGVRGDPAASLSHWRDLLLRLQREGIN